MQIILVFRLVEQTYCGAHVLSAILDLSRMHTSAWPMVYLARNSEFLAPCLQRVRLVAKRPKQSAHVQESRGRPELYFFVFRPRLGHGCAGRMDYRGLAVQGFDDNARNEFVCLTLASFGIAPL